MCCNLHALDRILPLSADAALRGVETLSLAVRHRPERFRPRPLWSGSLWRMSRFSELKATGTGLG